jgi:hypothetical protein
MNILARIKKYINKKEISSLSAFTVKEGDRISPWYYGVAYHRFDACISVWYPIPFNYIIRFCRIVQYAWDKLRSQPSWFDKEIIRVSANMQIKGHTQGFERGKSLGLKEGEQVTLDNLTRQLQEIREAVQTIDREKEEWEQAKRLVRLQEQERKKV